MDAALAQLKEEGYPVLDEMLRGCRPSFISTSICWVAILSRSPTWSLGVSYDHYGTLTMMIKWVLRSIAP